MVVVVVKEEYIEILKQLEISNSLMQYILAFDYTFTELELLKLIYDHSSDFDTRVNLLNHFYAIATDIEVKPKILIGIQYLLKSREMFLQAEEDCIYDLHILDITRPYDNREHLFGKTYQSVIAKLDLYYKHYSHIDVKETCNTRYIITKRNIRDFAAHDEFEDDAIGECLLKPGKIEYEYDYWPLRNYGANSDGTDDDRVWSEIESIEINYPDFIREYSLISFIDYGQNKTFGIVVPTSENSSPLSDLYILPISSKIFEVASSIQTDESNVHNFHQHIEIAKIEVENVDEVDDFTKECHAQLKFVLLL